MDLAAKLEAESIPEPNSGCLLWLGSMYRQGYGWLRLGERVFSAHRLSWEIANGRTIPPGLVVMHRCDNPGCINPDHLKIGTQRENLNDARRKGRMSQAPVGPPPPKLSAADVVAILRDVRPGRPVAQQYGVSKRRINQIRAAHKLATEPCI